MRIPDREIAKVCNLNPIGSIVGSTVDLSDAGGGNLKGLCPLHDDDSWSLRVVPLLGCWYCFACAEGGDVITFTRKTRNLTYSQAVEFLAAHAGIALTYEEIN
ncbi:CHC2 zinc finger domain-containing protein [Sphaerisporangium sp. TRM90804]|uniref:CHC2 zinc finger domain-containing protein n=1 Tax=Sphaerisporangium sp. TRM90804 TaxID=3031113 RepID=UPI00244AAD73|nr:CHC2 zinc finger domain-containing protein [Sphaerisporangium sp. TRM90804]MDH2424809.1 CHC2 zinc finger domain-containing protein [Sphaerisporangium sp. TRM90804]